MSANPPDPEAEVWRQAKRQELIARRLALSPAERAAASERITGRLNGLLADAPGRLIGFYWPFKGEYDPRPLVRGLHQTDVALALPVVIAKKQPLVFRPWRPGVPMAHGIWDIPIPAGGEPVQPDTLLVPLVGFDGEGYRLGYGGGFYDRTIAALPARPRTIGVGFACARLPSVRSRPHDIPMNRVVTDETD